MSRIRTFGASVIALAAGIGTAAAADLGYTPSAGSHLQSCPRIQLDRPLYRRPPRLWLGRRPDSRQGSDSERHRRRRLWRLQFPGGAQLRARRRRRHHRDRHVGHRRRGQGHQSLERHASAAAPATTGIVSWSTAPAVSRSARSKTKAGGVSDCNTNVGWTLGAGVEAAITNNVTARVEYRYTDLGSTNFANVGKLDYTSNQVLTGIGLKF